VPSLTQLHRSTIVIDPFDGKTAPAQPRRGLPVHDSATHACLIFFTLEEINPLFATISKKDRGYAYPSRFQETRPQHPSDVTPLDSILTCRTLAKSFRMNTYAKEGRGVGRMVNRAGFRAAAPAILNSLSHCFVTHFGRSSSVDGRWPAAPTHQLRITSHALFRHAPCK